MFLFVTIVKEVTNWRKIAVSVKPFSPFSLVHMVFSFESPNIPQIEMSWMKEKVKLRSDPSILWPEAKTCIMLGESYSPKHDPLEILKNPQKGAISVYAQNKDYHDVLKKRLKVLKMTLK